MTPPFPAVSPLDEGIASSSNERGLGAKILPSAGPSCSTASSHWADNPRDWMK